MDSRPALDRRVASRPADRPSMGPIVRTDEAQYLRNTQENGQIKNTKAVILTTPIRLKANGGMLPRMARAREVRTVVPDSGCVKGQGRGPGVADGAGDLVPTTTHLPAPQGCQLFVLAAGRQEQFPPLSPPRN
jgi:hypothetical protein